MRAPVGRRSAIAHDHVAGPPAHQRTGLLVEMGEQQHAAGAVGHGRERLGMNDLGNDEVLGELRPELQIGLPRDRLAFERAIAIEHLGAPQPLQPRARAGNAATRLAADAGDRDR